MAAPSIEDYRFGRMIVDGQAHGQDLILLPDRVIAGWWRNKGHELAPEDLRSVLEAAPDLLVVGTGAYGRMKVTRATKKVLREANIELRAAPTEEAYQIYNELREQQEVVGAFHLTC
ncbi:MAG: MTH938/NDUFAF3 family protein [Anaerolineae bacterium]|jgi:hypothetical protein